MANAKATRPHAGGDDPAEHLRALLAALTATTRVVVAARTISEVLDAACRTLVEQRVFSMVWVAADTDGDGWVERLAVAGDTFHYTDGIRISLSPDVPEGRGPTGTAIRTGEPFVCADVTTDPRMAPWRERYVAAGYRSSAAFRLGSVAMPSAALTAYASATDSFRAEESEILEDLARTIGLAIDAIAEREAREAEIGLEAQLRECLARAIQRSASDVPTEEVADALCEELAKVPGIDFAAVLSFVFADQWSSIAHRAPEGFPAATARATPRLGFIVDRILGGPWAEPWTRGDAESDWGQAFSEMGFRVFAYGPIVAGDRPAGCLALGTRDERVAEILLRRIGAIGELWNASSALLAERLERRRERIEARTRLDAIIEAGAFSTVFQPVVELGSGEITGYEALSRFADGTEPQAAFAQAWSVDLGHRLELATIRAAVEAGRSLPPSRSLHVNVSPRLLAEPRGLEPILRLADRPLVVEVTEREAIEDYGRLRKLLAKLGHEIRLAVDDAGAGLANFGHLVELDPDYVKLDPSLVRGINLALGRQALVVGLRHFSRRSGCRLIAEGIETPEEMATLVQLGVELGQGYLLGRPAPATSWVETRRTRVRPGGE